MQWASEEWIRPLLAYSLEAISTLDLDVARHMSQSPGHLSKRVEPLLREGVQRTPKTETNEISERT